MPNPEGYHLRITFKSNERPFSWNYEPYKVPEDEMEDWAQHMADGMGGDYIVQLFKGEKMVFAPSASPAIS